MSKEGGITSKIKKFFGNKQHQQFGNADGGLQRPNKPIIITSEHIKSISPGIPASARDRSISDLCLIIETSRLELLASEALLHAVEDLLATSQETSRRQLVFRFIHSLIKGQYEQLGMLREYIFYMLIKYRTHEDHQVCLDILNTLTKGGHDLDLIDQQIGNVLVKWLNDIAALSVRTGFLQLLVNVIKYNAAFIDEDDRLQLFEMSCFICNQSGNREDKELCLQVLESLLKYSYLKSSALKSLCMTLCHTVTQEGFDQRSWKLMQNFLGTHLGHSALFTIIGILEDRNNLTDAALLKGAIFFVSMALWGFQRVQSLQVSSTAVLPAFYAALKSQNNRVAFEVSIAVLRLVRKYGKNQPTAMWEQVLDILDALHLQIQRVTPLEAGQIQKVSFNVHDILTAMEELLDSGQYNSSSDRLFSFIEKCAVGRPENSVMMLLEYRAQSCRPPSDDWLCNLVNLLNKYFKCETRTAIRLKALAVFEQILNVNRLVFEDKLIDLMLQQLSSISTDRAVELRQAAVRLLVDQAKIYISSRCLDIINVINKVITRELEPNLKSSKGPAEIDYHCQDIKTAVCGLIEILKMKLSEPSGAQVVQAISDMLLTHMNSHYSYRYRSPTAKQIRLAVCELLLALRADLNGRVGLMGDISGSSHVYCAECYLTDEVKTGGAILAAIDFTRVLQCINQCLVEESNWKVLNMVLEKMPKQWQNKTLILSADNMTIEKLCRTLCNMLQDKQMRHLYEVPADFKKPDFDSEIFPVLTCMTSYHTCLQNARHDLIRCLEFGLVTKCAKICIHTLRVCCLEMENIMMKLLPSILLKLSQIAANKAMAMPLLIFLSCVVRIPKLYRNFNEADYRLIFAIAIPYTDPFRFSHFAVYLAYHVIAMWFVKCRLMYRKQFVSYIIKELQSNMKQFHSRASQDSASTAKDAVCDKQGLQNFHQELQETCIDFMARYTFSTCASVPKRSTVAEFLLEDGRSQTWFLGNKLITITTSGGGSKVTKTGLCQRCSAAVREPVNVQHSEFGKRRHRSAAVTTLSHPIGHSDAFSQDDIGLCVTSNQPIFAEGSKKSSLQSSASSSGDHEELITSLTHGKVEGRFNPSECNCWCKGWAEIYIRRPSGNTSWILRIQNQQLFNYEDFPLSDISSLFLSSPGKSPFHTVTSQKKIESGSLEEKEYEEQHEKHFHDIVKRSSARRKITMDDDSAFPIVAEGDEDDDVSVPSLKRRSHTISYSRLPVSPDGARRSVNTRDMRSSINPSFVFLQLYHTGFLNSSNLPMPINENQESHDRSLKNLDRIPPYETHKVGVVYVAPGQANDEAAILANTFGSKRYSEFLSRLGTLLCLKDVDPENMFVGGLDHEMNEDGRYTYTWHDEVIQMVFHVATLMPTKENDARCGNKKRHIGNDYVTVVYNDSKEEYVLGTIKGRFNYANIVIEPLDKVSNAVSIHCKDEIKDILGVHSTKVIRDENVANLVRQISLHASMASHIHKHLQDKQLYASNWLERLRQIKRMKENVSNKKRRNSEGDQIVTDFTEYV